MSWASEGMWAAQAAILNAMNLAGSHLPKALGLLLADWVNNSPLAAGARGDSHTPWVFVVDDHANAESAAQHAAAAAAAAAQQRGASWRRALAAALAVAGAAWAAVTFAARMAWLSVLFAPVVLTAPVALQWGWRRAEWMELLRVTLEAAGVSNPGSLGRCCYSHGLHFICKNDMGPCGANVERFYRAAGENLGTDAIGSIKSVQVNLKPAALPMPLPPPHLPHPLQPAWVKWGQWTATRHDLFPPDMCAALEVLHASAPAHAFRHTDEAISRAFGLPAAELFDWLEETPLASGSIGQVGVSCFFAACMILGWLRAEA